MVKKRNISEQISKLRKPLSPREHKFCRAMAKVGTSRQIEKLRKAAEERSGMLKPFEDRVLDEVLLLLRRAVLLLELADELFALRAEPDPEYLRVDFLFL